jgi:leucyl-tRNA synthetase
VLRDNPTIRVEARAHKMSKSRGNVVNPDEIINTYGADAFRLYEMFLGPLEQVKPWSTRGVEGTHRFLNRVWRLIAASDGESSSEAVTDAEPSREQLHALHQTLAKVTEDIEALRFNTAIAALMEFSNAAGKWSTLPRQIAESFVLMLAPLAPHIAEELWQRLGHAESIAYAAWPKVDTRYLVRETIEVPVQVNGKVRGKIEIPAEATEEQVLALARQDQNVARYLQETDIKRAIYVPKRIVNFVVSN